MHLELRMGAVHKQKAFGEADNEADLEDTRRGEGKLMSRLLRMKKFIRKCLDVFKD